MTTIEQRFQPKLEQLLPRLIYRCARSSVSYLVVELKLTKTKNKEGLSVFDGKKNIAITSENNVPVLEVTNEYGNSIKYTVDDKYRFDSLWSHLWQFIKDSQH